MDKLAALRIYITVYRACTWQLTDSRIAREWMEIMDIRSATREQLEQHAKRAAEWARHGYLPGEAARHIADGRGPIAASAYDARQLGIRYDRPTEIRPARG